MHDCLDSSASFATPVNEDTLPPTLNCSPQLFEKLAKQFVTSILPNQGTSSPNRLLAIYYFISLVLSGIIARRQKLTNVCFMSTSVSFFFLLSSCCIRNGCVLFANC